GTEARAGRRRRPPDAQWVAGANLHRVHLGEGLLQLPEHLDRLAEDVLRNRAAMVVFDPAPAYFSGNLNSDQSVRRVLTPLAAMADRTAAAIVLIRHLTKSGANKALYRGAGSIGLVGAARSCLLLARHPAEPDRRVVAPVKMNLIRPPQATTFQLVDIEEGAVLEWTGPTELTADQLLATHGEQGSALAEAVRVLYTLLAEGPVPAGEALKLLRRNGVADRTARRAKEVLDVTSRRRGFGRDSRFYWHLPPHGTLVQRLRDQEMTTLLDKLIHGSDDPYEVDCPPREPGTEDLAGGWESDDDADE
ncbi:MAG: AAA family ATPase, partial [Phycisphaeraceae bacterium]